MDSGDVYQTILTDGDSELTPIDAAMALATLHECLGQPLVYAKPAAAADSHPTVMLKPAK